MAIKPMIMEGRLSTLLVRKDLRLWCDSYWTKMSLVSNRRLMMDGCLSTLPVRKDRTVLENQLWTKQQPPLDNASHEGHEAVLHLFSWAALLHTVWVRSHMVIYRCTTMQCPSTRVRTGIYKFLFPSKMCSHFGPKCQCYII